MPQNRMKPAKGSVNTEGEPELARAQLRESELQIVIHQKTIDALIATGQVAKITRMEPQCDPRKRLSRFSIIGA